jgi:hypothetical protein
MASFIYNSANYDEATGAIDYDTHSFKAMLVTSAYTADKDAHTKRSQVTNEVTGAGYTAGGTPITVTVSSDTANDKVLVTFGAVAWAASTITARGCVIYRSTGNAATDNLVAFNDFGVDKTTAVTTFSIGAGVITKQN